MQHQAAHAQKAAMRFHANWLDTLRTIDRTADLWDPFAILNLDAENRGDRVHLAGTFAPSILMVAIVSVCLPFALSNALTVE
jgi:hypothetical protein